MKYYIKDGFGCYREMEDMENPTFLKFIKEFILTSVISVGLVALTLLFFYILFVYIL